MALNNASDLIKELEAEIEKEGGDPEGLRVPPKEEEDAPAKQERTTGDEATNQDEQAGEGDENEAQAGQEEADDDALSDDAKKRGKAFGAMRAETKQAKERADAAEKRASDLAERMARLEGREEGRNPEAKTRTDEDKEPDRLMYPDDWNDWDRRQLTKRVEKAERTAQQAQAYTTYQAEQRGAEVLERQYKAANPKEDVDGAAAFLMAREKEGMKLLRPDMSDAQIDSKLEADKLVLYRTLHGQGRDPVDVVVKLAKAQGFKPGMAGGKEVVAKTNLEKLADNQRRSTNLMGGSPAGKPKGKLSTDDVFNMAFTDLLKMPKSARDALNEGDE